MARGEREGSSSRASPTGTGRALMPLLAHRPGEVRDVPLVVAGHGDEQAARVLDALRRQTLQQGAFDLAFGRRVGIARDIASSAVQQTVVAAGGTGVEVVLLDQNAGDAA